MPIDQVGMIWFTGRVMTGAYLDPFWAGRRADHFDGLCR
jgi:hypothetical protein